MFIKHHWGKPDGKQLEKQVDAVLLLKTRHWGLAQACPKDLDTIMT